MSEGETIQLSDSAAVVYEQDFIPAIFGQWPPVLADAVALKPGDRVLDAGCGTGIFAREALVRVGATGSVVGLDVNESMLSVARRVRPDIEWRQGDVAALPFDDASFDAVVSQFVLMFVPDRAAALREMWRVLAPGGRLGVAVWAPFARSTGYVALAELVQRYMGEDAAAAIAAPFALGDAQEVLALFQSAGIAGVRLVEHDGWARFASTDDLVRVEIKGWVLAESADGGAYEALVSEAREALPGFWDEEGRIAFPMDALVVTAEKA